MPRVKPRTETPGLEKKVQVKKRTRIKKKTEKKLKGKMKTKVSLFGFLKCGVLNRALLFLFCAALPNVQSIAFEHVYLEKYNPNEKIEFYCNTSFETPYYGEWFVFIKAGFQNECYGPVYKV